MKIHVLYHTKRKFLGFVREWIEERKHFAEILSLKKGDVLPNIDDVEMLIVIGGPVNVNNHIKNPWLAEEKQFVAELIKTNKPVLGLCLGAEIIATALGYTVEHNTKPEIGWHDVHLNEFGQKNPFFKGISKLFRPFHLHRDIIRLPDNINSLAYSEVTDVQAFTVQKALALQFHLEPTEEILTLMLERMEATLEKDTFVQTADEIREQFENINNSRILLFQILDNFVELI